MENASKALLIAGSILIVILLIAFGMRIVNYSSGPVDSVEDTMKTTEIATFNSKFLQYAGTNKSLSQVKSLANMIIAHNATDTKYKVLFNGKDKASEITGEVLKISEGTHSIAVGYDDNTGLVNSITIDQKVDGNNYVEDFWGS